MDNPSGVLLWMIGICCAVVICMVFSKPLKLLLRVGINAAAGSAIVYGLNLVLGPLTGLEIGLNIVTIAVLGVLGLPGIVALFAVQAIL